ncbi:substrate-binding domain-containing protein [Glacieibacterium sp.]|uniref:substrate-binding domain-containing protein n=1 Tax=Glacieibacterium sp. TaxID=2860237 RepID=UPI003B00F5EA
MTAIVRSLLAVAIVAAAGTALATANAVTAPRRVLTVCADPNNLPFSNRAGEGFENRIATLLAKEMNADINYVWWAQRRGYVRNTLTEAKCDIWPGVASGVDMVTTTKPYYRSTYVFVTRADKPLSGLSFDDARLKRAKVGVQMVGADASNTPPAHALARRGIIDNVRGFMLYGDYAKPNPPAAIIDAVASGEIDVAVVWGPLGGYFAAKSPVELRVEPVTPQLDGASWPMTYDISMGVRRNTPAVQSEVETILAKQAGEVAAILAEYHVPRVAGAGTQ